jgi:hypothetical protein
MICTCCKRQADPYVALSGEPPGWLCNLCETLWRKLLMLNPVRLTEIETEAIRKSGAHIAPQLLDTILTVMWREGTRDLASVSAERLAVIQSAVAADPAFQAIIADLFLEYTKKVRLLLVNEQ